MTDLTTTREMVLDGADAQKERALAPLRAEPGQLIAAIVSLARDPATDVAKMGALMQMQERLEERQAEAEFNAALADLAQILPPIKKNGTIELGETKDGRKRGAIPFAKYEDMDRVIRPLLSERGMCLTFDGAPRAGEGGGMIVTGTLLHRNGHKRTASIPLPLDTGPGRNNLQAMGSTLSYGKRYCAEMLLNLVREGQDDDGARGGMKFVSDVQADELLKLLELTKTEESRFLAMMVSGCHSVNEVEERDFIRLKNALLQKRAQQTAKAGEPT